MFSTAESKPHSYRRRVIANVYSKSYLQSSPEMHKIAQVMIFSRIFPILETAVIEQKPVEVLELSHAIAMDFIAAFMFGLQNGPNFTQDVSARRHFLATYRSRRPYRFWSGELPGLKSILSKIGPIIEPKFVQEATNYLENWTISRTKAAEKSSATKVSYGEEDIPTTTPIVYNQVHQSTLNNPFPYPQDLQIASELQDHWAAGQETSGITLCYLFHQLSLHPELQEQLRKEFLTLSPTLEHPRPSNPKLPSPQSLDALPLLHACLMETLRLHAAIPGPEPRITPTKPTSLAGSPPLPPGVRVSSQPYTLHRRADVFPDPEAWKPERWLEAREEQKAEMGRWFWAFGSGGRMCIGSNFAMQGMYFLERCRRDGRGSGADDALSRDEIDNGCDLHELQNAYC